MGKHNLCWACSGEIVWSDADFDRWWSEKKGNLYERSFEDADAVLVEAAKNTLPSSADGQSRDQETLVGAIREAERALASAPSERVQEAIRGRMRLYDSQIDPDCIGTGYGVEDIITMSELEQLVGFVRQSPEPPNPRRRKRIKKFLADHDLTVSEERKP
jgi:hypothetical protein